MKPQTIVVNQMLVSVYAAREFGQLNQSIKRINNIGEFYSEFAFFFKFVLNGISHSYQWEQSISVILLDRWYFSFFEILIDHSFL